MQKKVLTLAIMLLLFALIMNHARAQKANPQNVDSFKKAISVAKDDTGKVNMLSAVAMFYSNGDPKQGLKYSESAADISGKIKWKPGMAAAYNSLGVNYKSLSDYPNALENYFKSLKINEELNNRINIARNTANIGNVYRELKNYPKALEYFTRSMTENEQLGRKFGLTNNLSDIAIVYSEINDNPRALQYFTKALKISEEIDDKEGEAIIYGNLGNVYGEMHRQDLALENFLKSLEINKMLNRKIGLGVNYDNIGKTYFTLAIDSNSAGKDREANLDKAISYYNEAIPIFSELSATGLLSENYNGLSEVYLARKDYKKAFDAYKEYKKLNDSVFSNDNKVKLANLTTERAEYEEKQQEALTQLSQNKRRNETILFISAILVFSVFTAFLIRERRKSDKLLLNILPATVAAELKEKGSAVARNFDNVTVLFTDFVNFTSVAETMDPNELVKELDTCFKEFDEITSKYGIEKIKTVGDAYIAVAGLPLPTKMHAEDIVNAALDIIAFISRRKAKLGDKTFDIRVGVNSGSVVAGIVGVKKFAYDIWGDTVNTAARMEQNSMPGKINISHTTYELVKDKFTCTYRGEHEAKNKGVLAMYFVEGIKVPGEV